MSIDYKIVNSLEQYERLLQITNSEERKDFFRYMMM